MLFRSAEKFMQIAEPYIRQSVESAAIDINELAPILQPRCERLTDIPDKIDFFEALPEYEIDLYTNKKSKTDPAISLQMLKVALEALAKIDNWTDEDIHSVLISTAGNLGVKNATVMWPVRIAVAGKQVTPGGAVEICKILGRAETTNRIKLAIEKLDKHTSKN